MKAEQLTAVTCFHCGDPCAEEHRKHDDKDFCCHGCEVVYDLLNEAGLCDYYELEKQPGVKQRTSVDEQRSEFFDLDDVRARLVEFSEEGITRVRFHVPQMHCSSCIWLLENLDRVEKAVIRSRVSFADKELTITFREGQLSLAGLVKSFAPDRLCSTADQCRVGPKAARCAAHALCAPGGGRFRVR